MKQANIMYVAMVILRTRLNYNNLIVVMDKYIILYLYTSEIFKTTLMSRELVSFIFEQIIH